MPAYLEQLFLTAQMPMLKTQVNNLILYLIKLRKLGMGNLNIEEAQGRDLL